MKRKHFTKVTAQTAIAAPAAFALPAVETILREFGNPANASLALNASELGIPFQGIVSVPVRARVTAGNARNEWTLRITAAAHESLYPAFEGSLSLLYAAYGSELRLDGAYEVPLEQLGHALDRTVFRGAAKSSLERFLREIAHRVAALLRWAQTA
jgi:hypothetical protein